jgi:hypothetical protein
VIKLAVDQFAETLAAAGVKMIYGIVGDTVNVQTSRSASCCLVRCAGGITALLIFQAITFGLIFPKMCIEHFHLCIAKSNPPG